MAERRKACTSRNTVEGQVISRAKIERFERDQHRKTAQAYDEAPPSAGVGDEEQLQEEEFAEDLVTVQPAGSLMLRPAQPGRPISTVLFNRNIESLVLDIDQFYDGYFRWNCKDLHATRLQRRPAVDASKAGTTAHNGSETVLARQPHPQRLQNQFGAAVKMLDRGYLMSGLRLLRGIQFAQELSEEQHPRLLGCLVVMARKDTSKVNGWEVLLWNYLESTSSQVLGRTHPLTKLCHFLRHGTSEDKKAFLEPIFRHDYELFDRNLGPTHDKTLRARLNLLDIRLGNKQNLFSVEEELKECFNRCELLYDSNDVLTRTVMYRQAWVEEDDRNYGNAERIYREIIQRSETHVGTSPHDRIGVRVRVRLAAMLSKLGDYKDSEMLLRQALDESIECFGLDDYETCVILSALADNLRKQGANESLKALKNDHIWFFTDDG